MYTLNGLIDFLQPDITTHLLTFETETFEDKIKRSTFLVLVK